MSVNSLSLIQISDADIKSGISFFLSIYPQKFRIAKFLTSHRAIYRAVLVPFLQQYKKKDALRFKYPFLNLPDCPDIYKIMLADRITAYHTACEAHTKLLEFNSLEELQSTAKTVVENMVLNHQITQEFDHYKLYNKPLGKLPYFKKSGDVGAENDILLYKKLFNCKGRIRALKNQIKKTKDNERALLLTTRLNAKKAELLLLQNKINVYE